jgi:hypothetical protein
MSVDDLYKSILFLIRKNQSGSFSSTDFGYAFNGEQAAYQSDLLGRFQARSNGKSGFNTGLIENETIMTKLMPFIKSYALPIVVGSGTKPTDFIYTLAVRINNAKAFQVNHDEIWSVKDDVIDPPSIADNSYYYTEYGNYYSFLPNTVTAAELDYVGAPPDVRWAFTLSGGQQVYDSGNSAQSLWDDNSNKEICARILKRLGVSLSSQEFEQFGQSVINSGN